MGGYSGAYDRDHTLVARSDAGGFALRSGVLSGTEEVTLVLHRGGRIQLELIGPDGAPVVGAFTLGVREAAEREARWQR